MPDDIKINTGRLKELLTEYKASFVENLLGGNGANGELYKWQAVQWFHDHWDIDAQDFPAMLRMSLDKTGNLLVASNFFPRRMIEAFAESEPEQVRMMFRDLFNEQTDIKARVASFDKESQDRLSSHPEARNHYQTPNTISTYLWLRYPDKYYVYKYTIAKDNAEKLAGITLPSGKYDRMVTTFQLYDAICAELAKDADLVDLMRTNLPSDAYPDPALKTLTGDFGFFTQHRGDLPGAAQSTSTSAPSSMDSQNIILYGPPGTGKTYATAQYAVSIIEGKPLGVVKEEPYADVIRRYRRYTSAGLVAFTTFHQAFGYEEFIEGIRPVTDDDTDLDTSSGIHYEIRDGIFKEFCDRAGAPVPQDRDLELGIGRDAKIWKVSLQKTGDNPIRQDCLQNGYIRIGWGDPEPGAILTGPGTSILQSFDDRMQIGDLVLSCYSSQTVDAIGVITGDSDYNWDWPEYRRFRPVKWLVKGINANIIDLNNGCQMVQPTVYRLKISRSDALQFLKTLTPNLFTQESEPKNHVFVIDEINRGNISKIFGELITLIEPSKRIGADEELRARLPYSGSRFGVPGNVYVLGTMNTADRSIAMIDTALRRRFRFVEMQPDSTVLSDVFVEGIDMEELLDTMNRRISVLLDREHTVGHSFFLPLKADPTLDRLARIFEDQIVPLLQEYFYDDYEKIQLVLGDDQKTDDSIRFIVQRRDGAKLFKNADLGDLVLYEINRKAFKKAEAYGFFS